MDPPSFNFGTLDPNSETSQTLLLTVNSDINTEWSITLYATPLTHSDEATTFPAANYRYWFTFNYPGTEDPVYLSDKAIPTTSATVYTADSTEYTANPRVYGMGFKAIVSPVQKAGTYSSQINLTLVQNF